MTQKKIILASSSPRRKALLEQVGLEFDIVISEVDEIVDPTLSPEEVVKSLAHQKAMAVASKVRGDTLVIGADTIVAINDEIIGKPRNKEEIYAMLKRLSGNTHKVITWVCIIDTSNNKSFIDQNTSYVTFRKIDDDEIMKYIASGEPTDKAGSYAIQGIASIFIEKIEGNYSDIVGLPLCTLDKMLKQFGMNVLK